MASIFIAFAGLVTLLGLEYKTAFLEIYTGAQWKVGTGEVALTFDDCPLEPYTSKILDSLSIYGVKTTFFITGRRAEKYPEVVKRIKREGHSIGNHGYTDRRPALFSEDSIEKDIIRTQKILEEITGEKPLLFRPPSGIPRRDILETVKEERLKIVLADVIIFNEREKSSEEIKSYLIEEAGSGSIILLHGDHRETVGAISDLIKGIIRKNLNFVTIEG